MITLVREPTTALNSKVRGGVTRSIERPFQNSPGFSRGSHA